ncbi:MAG: NAD(P)-binding domain-containing protein, partial [Pseudomonadales bacterium]
MKEKLLTLISQKEAVIGIFGLGYVGLPLLLRYSSLGFRVLGFDIDQNKVDALNQGQSYIKHISEQRIQLAKKAGFQATADFNRVVEADALILCVPTPLNKYREPDLSFVISTTEM